MVHLEPDDLSSTTELPRNTAELRAWVRSQLRLDDERTHQLLHALEHVMARQRQLLEESKHDAMRALSEGFAAKMERLQRQLTEKDVTVSNIARYFEEVVADLTEKSHHDPKTKLLNFDWFMERVESFLAVEQRVRWCGVGVVDITSFKWYNDTFGHATGDRIIERVARILSDQIRSEDFLALERGAAEARDLHAPICRDAPRRSRSRTGSRRPCRRTTGRETIAAWRRGRCRSTLAWSVSGSAA
jgi:GGDEF domain-containing protein